MPLGDSMRNWEGLEEIVVVADAGSFVGGARILNVSTSHISRAVARLEARIGTPIFSRTTRHVALTATGSVLVERARHIIEERENLLTSLGGAADIAGDLRITCSAALGERFIAPVARAFARQHPRITLMLDFSNRLVDIIGEGYDLAIRTGHVSDPRLAGRQLIMRPYMTCAAPAYVAEHGAPERPEDLARHDCLVGTAAVWHFMDGDSPRTVTPHSAWRCTSGSVVAQAAVEAMGICHLPAYYVREHLAAGRLVSLLDRYSRAPEPVLAVYPRRGHLAPKVVGFVDELVATWRQVPAA